MQSKGGGNWRLNKKWTDKEEDIDKTITGMYWNTAKLVGTLQRINEKNVCEKYVRNCEARLQYTIEIAGDQEKMEYCDSYYKSE